jgi:putative aldouronate transport system permease protein
MAKTQIAPGKRLALRNPKGGTSFWARLWAQRELWIMLIPGIVFYAIFRYGPMYGLRLAFIDYSPISGYDASPWVGFKNFERLFVRNIDEFWLMLKNTLTISLLTFGTSFPLTILFALILNEVRMPRIKKTYQTVSYLPTFLSGVIIASIFIEMFSVKNGLVNKVIQALGFSPVNFMLEPWGYYLVYVLSGLWAGIGNGAIIYLSALAGVDQEMYEAAEIDGCSRLKRIWHITLPAIAPTVITMFLLNIGSLIRVGADKSLLLRTDMIIKDVYIFSTYVYDQGIIGNQTSYTAAVGMFESVVSALLLFTFNYIAKKRSGTSIW